MVEGDEEEEKLRKENLASLGRPQNVSISSLLKPKESEIVGRWQVDLGLYDSAQHVVNYFSDEFEERLKSVPKEMQERIRFLREIELSNFNEATDELINAYNSMLPKHVVNETEALLEQTPPELEALAKAFPRTLSALYRYNKKSWDTFVLCDGCSTYVRIHDLEIHVLDGEQKAVVALHCRPEFDVTLKPDLTLALRDITPQSVADAYKDVAIISKVIKGDGTTQEYMFETEMPEARTTNPSAISNSINSMLGRALVMFHNFEVPMELQNLYQYFPTLLQALFTYNNSWNASLRCPKCQGYANLSELKVYILSSDKEAVAVHCVPDLRDAGMNHDILYNLMNNHAVLKNLDIAGRGEMIFDEELKDPSSKRNAKENEKKMEPLLEKGLVVYRNSIVVRKPTPAVLVK